MLTQILSRLIYCFAKLLHLTYRYEQYGSENLEQALKGPSGSYIVCLWHQNILPCLLSQTGVKSYVVIASRSKDSEPVAYTCRKLGHQVVRGSSTRKGGKNKGGREAKEEMIELIKKGYPGAVSVDGPRGPLKRVQPGIINMAQRTNSPIIPMFARGDKNWVFNSWDKFHLPKPFAKIYVKFGEPIYLDKSHEMSSNSQEYVRSKMFELEEEYYNNYF